MSEHVVTILSITKLTHNVKEFRVEKPAGYTFRAGQAADVAVNRDDWDNEIRPFTLTSLPTDPYLEFTIKTYRDHAGVSRLMDTLRRDQELVISDPWGDFRYRGPGLFLAGGAGITPFLAMIRQLAFDGQLQGNRLLWANTSEHDVFHEKELRELLGSNFVPVVGHPKSGAIKKLLKPITDWAYVCGPEAFEEAAADLVTELGLPTIRILRDEDEEEEDEAAE